MNWKCPYCGTHTTLIKNTSMQFKDFTSSVPGIDLKKDQYYKFHAIFIACPNTKCKKLTLKARLGVYTTTYPTGFAKENQIKEIKSWDLLPQGIYTQFPDYIPLPIREDYQEACQIRELSPKASATLARRCLQGMIRDFWGITKGTLNNQITQLEDRVTPDIYEAIDAIRKIGNIGAHMKKDINLIVEIDEDEAGQLIWLIELLMKEWYVAKYERQERLKGLKALGDKE